MEAVSSRLLPGPGVVKKEGQCLGVEETTQEVVRGVSSALVG